MSSPLMRWGFVFLHCPLQLSEEQREGLVLLAVQAYFREESKVLFDWEEARGEVRVTSDTRSFGHFTGQSFEAEVHLPDRQGLVRFLVTERQLQAFSGPVPEA